MPFHPTFVDSKGVTRFGQRALCVHQNALLETFFRAHVGKASKTPI